MSTEQVQVLEQLQGVYSIVCKTVYNAGLEKDLNYQYSSLLCLSLSHSAHNLLNVLFQLFSMERLQYTLEGNWMMVMSQVGVSIETICRNH